MFCSCIFNIEITFTDNIITMDRFKVIEMIGEGSFGRVFKAVERDTGQTVALKLIPKVRLFI